MRNWIGEWSEWCMCVSCVDLSENMQIMWFLRWKQKIEIAHFSVSFINVLLSLHCVHVTHYTLHKTTCSVFILKIVSICIFYFFSFNLFVQCTTNDTIAWDDESFLESVLLSLLSIVSSKCKMSKDNSPKNCSHNNGKRTSVSFSIPNKDQNPIHKFFIFINKKTFEQANKWWFQTVYENPETIQRMKSNPFCTFHGFNSRCTSYVSISLSLHSSSFRIVILSSPVWI